MYVPYKLDAKLTLLLFQKLDYTISIEIGLKQEAFEPRLSQAKLKPETQSVSSKEGLTQP